MGLLLLSLQFEADGVVAPSCLQKGLFTVGALDNIDHNPSSTTVSGCVSWYWKSLFQFPTKKIPGEIRTLATSQKRQHFLPDSNAIVPAVAMKPSAVDVPHLSSPSATVSIIYNY